MTTNQNQPEEAARTKGQVRRQYNKLVRSEARTEVLKCLQVRRLGTPEIEEFLRRIYSKQGKGRGFDDKVNYGKDLGRDRIVKLILESKIRDAEKEERERRREYWKMRKKMAKEIGNNRQTIRAVEEIRLEGKNIKIKIRKKNKDKVEHLEEKYRSRARIGLNELITRYRRRSCQTPPYERD